MDVDAIANILKNSIGLDKDSVSKSFIEAAVKSRINKTQTSNADYYLQRLKDSPMELAELIEEAVIPETWFFRDAEAIWSLVRDAQVQLLKDNKVTLRILSLPCASGEEPYSLAMGLINAGIAAKRFQIDAIDVSQRVLEQARRAVYGSNSFRGVAMQPFRKRYFDPIDTKWCLHDSIRELVNFRQGNVLEANFTLEKAAYDAIFCRNLLIYFDRETQLRTVSLLLSLLRPGGTVYVGPAEGGLLLAQGLRSNGVPLAFGFERGEQLVLHKIQRDTKSEQINQKVVTHPTILPKPVKIIPRPVLNPIANTQPLQQPATPLSLLAIANLANLGKLAEAISHYEDFVRANGSSAQVLYLLALAHDADGNSIQAEQNYRKALYLDPRHQEAMQHLALLLDVQGNPDAAKQLRQRAARLQATNYG
jgi:chemotaxis protein methyltransferase WspC